MKTKIIAFTILFSFFVLMPSSALALRSVVSRDGSTTTTSSKAGSFCDNSIKDLTTLVNFGTCILIKSIVPLLFAVALVLFIWGVVQFIQGADNEEKRKTGRDFMIYGIIALFVMVSVWGLVNVLSNTFGIDTFIPQLQQQ